MELGFVLSTAPARGDLPRLERLARAARARGLEVSIFVMSEGVLTDPRALARLHDDGCEVIVCAQSLERAGRAAPPGVTLGSQDDHAAIVHRAARVVAFT